MIQSVMQASVLNFTDSLPFNYFDVALLVWLGVGVFRGRKHGMSQELLLVLQWLLIIVVCSLGYKVVAQFILQNSPMSMLWANVFGYTIIALIIRAVLMRLKTMMGDKLVGSDIFGRGEYYLGMMAGALRFACMAIMLMAFMNAKIVSKEEREATERMQAKNFEGIRFPTYGEVQQIVLFESGSGQFARKYLSDYLITSSTSETKPLRNENSIGRKRESAVNEVLGAVPARKSP